MLKPVIEIQEAVKCFRNRTSHLDRLCAILLPSSPSSVLKKTNPPAGSIDPPTPSPPPCPVQRSEILAQSVDGAKIAL